MGKEKIIFGSSRSSGASASATSTKRDCMQIYSIYGMPDESQTLLFFLLFYAALFALLSVLLLLYFSSILSFIGNSAALRFLLGSSGSVVAVSSLFLLFAAANVLHSSLSLHWDMCQRVVATVPDWSLVRTALDVRCDRGILLNSVAMQLKKHGGQGRVIGLDNRKTTAVAALRTACLEGVQDYVTCREGDAGSIPFADSYFDAVVSAVHLSHLSKGLATGGAAERSKEIGEVVRVLKPGGVGVMWDVGCVVPEYVQRLREMRMENITVSKRITVYMLGSHILSFRKPMVEVEDQYHQYHPLDWRANIHC